MSQFGETQWPGDVAGHESLNMINQGSYAGSSRSLRTDENQG